MENGKSLVIFVETNDKYYLGHMFKDTVYIPEPFVGRMLP